MLEELTESEASGDIAHIYERIRQQTRVPYVSSLQRHLATRPGHLQWAWQVVGELFETTQAQSEAWQTAGNISFPQPRNYHGRLLREIGNEDDVSAIKNVFRSFIRVSPTNLVVSFILKHRLTEPDRVVNSDPDGAGPVELSNRSTVRLPKMLTPLPPLVELSNLDEKTAGDLRRLSVNVGGKVFIPGLYRMLAHWPKYLNHVANVLSEDSVQRTLAPLISRLPQELDQCAMTLELRCPAVPPPVTPGSDAANELVETIESYRRTSPEMVIFSSFLLNEIYQDAAT